MWSAAPFALKPQDQQNQKNPPHLMASSSSFACNWRAATQGWWETFGSLPFVVHVPVGRVRVAAAFGLARQCQRVQCRGQTEQVSLGIQEQGSVQQNGVMQAETKKKCSIVRPNHRLASLVCLLWFLVSIWRSVICCPWSGWWRSWCTSSLFLLLWYCICSAFQVG